MAKKRAQHRSGSGRQGGGTPPSTAMSSAPDEGMRAAFEEIEHLLETPLAELMGSEEERVEVEKLGARAAAAPAMAPFREVVTFVGRGRPVTQAGNLKVADARALARRLGRDEDVEQVGSLNDLADTAAIFRWAAASGLIEVHGNKVIPGPIAPDLERDPLSAWLSITVTLLEQGILDGFHQGWRKHYLELLDGSVPGLLMTLAEAGEVSLTAIESEGWRLVADSCGYEPNDAAERRHVRRLVRSMVSQLIELGVVDMNDDEVVLTPLGGPLAGVILLSTADDSYDPEDLDLIDTDAASLLLVCSDEMEHDEATRHLLAWCQGRPADEAADELCAALLDEEDPEVWPLGFEALAMLDRAVVKRAARRLQSHPGLGPLAAKWLP